MAETGRTTPSPLAVTPPEQADFAITDLIQDRPEWNRVARGWLSARASERTLQAYRYDLTEFFRWCHRRGIDVLTAEQEDIDVYRHHLARKHEGATVARKLASLSSFYRHGRRRFSKIVPDNPVLDVERPPGSQESTAAGLDADEVRALFAAADRSSVTDGAMMRLLVFVGLRVAELRGATVADMRTERGERVVRVTRKGGKRQTLVVPNEAARWIDRHLDGRSDGPLFIGTRGGPVSHYEVAKTVDRLVVAASIDKPITPHSLRHTYATLALDAGVHIRDLQVAMGHRNVETTMRYDTARERVDRSPANALAKLLGTDNSVRGAP